jgi:hypothetical protein
MHPSLISFDAGGNSRTSNHSLPKIPWGRSRRRNRGPNTTKKITANLMAKIS